MTSDVSRFLARRFTATGNKIRDRKGGGERRIREREGRRNLKGVPGRIF